MRPWPVAIAAVLVMIGSRAMASPCPQVALVEGDDAIVTPIRETLRTRGIATESVAGCPFIHAVIAGAVPALVVEIEDGYGRTTERTIADPALAATFIESWVRVDEETVLLAARSWVPREQAPAAAPPTAVVSTSSGHGASRSLGASVALETSRAQDDSSWFGLAAATCVRFGPACGGVELRFASDSQRSGSSAELATKRTAFDLLIAVDTPLRWRELRITPGAGFGLGWVRSGRVTMGGANDIDAGGLRLDAHVTFAIPIRQWFTVGLGASLSASPFAHVATYVEEGSMVAGEPRWFARLGLGLTFGAQP